jgi:hypothetical protein
MPAHERLEGALIAIQESLQQLSVGLIGVQWIEDPPQAGHNGLKLPGHR